MSNSYSYSSRKGAWDSILFIYMQVFDEIREQIHEIRNLVAPFDLKLASLDHQIAQSRVLFADRAAAIESKLRANSFRIDEQGSQICEILERYGQLSERIKWIENIMKVPPRPGRQQSHRSPEDQTSPHNPEV